MDVQGQDGGKNVDIDGKVWWWSQKVDQFYACHTCIVPYFLTLKCG